MDSETGLQLHGWRYYDASVGRWLNQDPLGLGPDPNPYRYVGNNSTNLIDPYGLEAEEAGPLGARVNDPEGEGDVNAPVGEEHERVEICRPCPRRGGPKPRMFDPTAPMMDEMMRRFGDPSYADRHRYPMQADAFTEDEEELSELEQKLDSILSKLLTAPSADDIQEFLLGVAIGFFKDGLWGTVESAVGLVKFAVKYHPVVTAFRGGRGLWNGGLQGLENEFKDEIDFAEKTAHLIAKLGRDGVAKLKKHLNDVREILTAALNGDKKTLLRKLRELGDEQRAILEAVAGLALDLVDDLVSLSPRDKGRIVGLIYYQVVEEVLIAVATWGIGNAAKSPATVAKIVAGLVKVGLKGQKVEAAVWKALRTLDRLLEAGAKPAKARKNRPNARANTPKRVTGKALAKMRKEFNAKKPSLWKEEARRNPHKYSKEQLKAMEKGDTPIGWDGEPMEIHHKKELGAGGTNDYDNMQFLTFTEHRSKGVFKKMHPRIFRKGERK